MLGEHKELLLAGAVLLGVFFITGVYFYTKNCSIAKEIQTYVGIKDNIYLFGTNFCPQTWSLKKTNIKQIKNLPKDKSTEIISYKADPSLEKILTEEFLGYNKYIAGDGAKTFVIYETICKLCKVNEK